MIEEYFPDDPRTQLERMLAGDLYVADDPELQRRSEEARRLAHEYAAASIERPGDARGILSELRGELGEDAVVRPPLYVDYGCNIAIGPRTSVNCGNPAHVVRRVG